MVINANANIFTHLSWSQREDTMFDGTSHKKHVNDVLGNLVHLHYPSEVSWSSDTSSATTCLPDYGLSSDAMYGNAQGLCGVTSG
jgi:hypothetical protein